MSTHTIAGVEVGDGQPCRFVAEISNNHNGDIDRAFRLILAAKEAGADFVKFQCYTPDELVELRGNGPAPGPWGAEGWSMHDLYTEAQTPHEWFPTLALYCDTAGIPWFSSVFGPQSLELLERLDCPAYKIAALDAGSEELFEMVLDTGKPVIGSERGPTPKVWERALYCPEGYPQTDFHLANIRNGFLGFSYHGIDGGTPFIAAMAGAHIVEVHLQLADEPSELESNVSLNEHALKDLIDATREAEEWIR